MIGKIVLGLFALMGTPLFALIAATAILGFMADGLDASLVAMEIHRLVDTPVLVSIPLFTFAGELMARANTSERLVGVSRALLGWMPGGLGIVTLLVCAAFTALTGASGVTIIALGALLYPSLTREGYPERFSLGLVTTSGSLGLLFPPAIPLILFGIIAREDINNLFLAGIVPGALMILLLALWCVRQGWKSRLELTPFQAGPLLRAARKAIWELPLPVIVLGGIYSGWFALGEAAAVTAAYVLVVEVLIYRDVPWRELGRVMRRSMTLVGGILIILAVSQASTNLLIDREIPQRLFEFVQGWFTSKWSFLMALNLFLLMLGAVLDIFSATVLVVPLLLPIAAGYGVHPVHLGVIFLANMEIGYCTPPVGLNLFIASYRFKQPILHTCRASLPFLAILAVVVLLVTYVPALSLWLPGLL
ncbi:TRAP transporter, DctM subunit [Paucidesulfovibrio gracilis DSM 16080]|uniref:TRAP transporter, DctM subunit n=1 Tax=Paucidesulfovibrio gracilis DSM 16080 TaxID=1121449 RepID=A0A1T4XML3_9BACT|nr:TRAP transporter large permease subunit [Paucidesulfovibrio gracilis]SKA90398.1 TRAP transporter, DctM subunit [Paucidesulfovibrio gracilis DSM 16080]